MDCSASGRCDPADFRQEACSCWRPLHSGFRLCCVIGMDKATQRCINAANPLLWVLCSTEFLLSQSERGISTSDRTHGCNDCARSHQQLQQKATSAAAAPSPPPSSPPPPPLFSRDEHSHGHLNQAHQAGLRLAARGRRRWGSFALHTSTSPVACRWTTQRRSLNRRRTVGSLHATRRSAWYAATTITWRAARDQQVACGTAVWRSRCTAH